MYGFRRCPSGCLSRKFSRFTLLTGLVLAAFTDRGDFADSGEDDKIGIEGLLRFATVLCAGSEGPGLGVVRESSESSVVGCDCSEAVELDTGEQGSGAIAVGPGYMS